MADHTILVTGGHGFVGAALSSSSSVWFSREGVGSKWELVRSVSDCVCRDLQTGTAQVKCVMEFP